MSKGIKLVILDECDAITSAAQFSLRRVIEKYTKTTRFCLICNYVSKIIPALQSRCTRFRFSPLKHDDISVRLTEIAESENIKLEPEASEAIVKLSGGDMRKVLNVLESASLAHDGDIKVEDVYNCTGKPSPQEIETIMKTLLKDDFNTIFGKIMKIKTERSLTLEDIVQDLHYKVMESGLNPKQKMFIVQRMASLEERIAIGATEKMQIASLTGVFIEIR